MRLRALSSIKPVYIIPRDNLAQEVLVPALTDAVRYDIMTAFFQSGALKEIAPGLAAFISNGRGRIRLIIGPLLADQDREAIRRGIENPPEVLERWFRKYIDDCLVDSHALTKYTLECLSLLISKEDIMIRLAVMKNGASFHEKVSIISDGDDTVVIHGSTNFTLPGYTANKENARIERSWGDNSESQAVNSFMEEFERNWNNEDDALITCSLSDGFKGNIIKEYTPSAPISIKDYWEILEETRQSKVVDSGTSERQFAVPDQIRFEDGPFAHQGKAIEAWFESDKRGILQMCTGSGKTIASLICANKLFQEKKPLFVIVSAPYLPLIHQWEREARKFGLMPIVTSGQSRGEKMNRLNRAIQRIKFRSSDIEFAAVTNHLLCDKEFRGLMMKCKSEILLIADEMHNLGTHNFLSDPPDFIRYRIGLSATPIRQYDEVGTRHLLKFFGNVVFKFDLGDAIGRCLVPYEYYVHPITLSEEEEERWVRLTEKIRKLGWTFDDDAIENPAVEGLLTKRRLVVEQAVGKLHKLRELLLAKKRNSIKHTLIYASDKGRKQLDDVNDLVINELGILTHQVTHDETNRGLSQEILEEFGSGKSLQLLTAMRVLDEGLDIPPISTAYILASTTVERQWVQRRGRVLRKCPEIGKTKAEIHDFFVVPPPSREFDALMKGEIKRIREFGKLADNAYRDDGPLLTIKPYTERAYSRSM